MNDEKKIVCDICDKEITGYKTCMSCLSTWCIDCEINENQPPDQSGSTCPNCGSQNIVNVMDFTLTDHETSQDPNDQDDVRDNDRISSVAKENSKKIDELLLIVKSLSRSLRSLTSAVQKIDREKRR